MKCHSHCLLSTVSCLKANTDIRQLAFVDNLVMMTTVADVSNYKLTALYCQALHTLLFDFFYKTTENLQTEPRCMQEK